MSVGEIKWSGVVWVAAALAAFIVLLGVFFGPRPAFALLCHQLPYRSFTVDGHLLSVCHRCSGIYAGLFAGLVAGIVPLFRGAAETRVLSWLAVAAAGVTLDVALDAIGVLANSPASRTITGFGLGLVAGMFLAAIALDGNRTRRSQTAQVSPRQISPIRP